MTPTHRTDRTDRPPTHRWLAWLAPLLLATGCVVGGGEQTYRYDGLTGITIELGSGEVEVLGQPDGCCETEVNLDLGGVGQKAARGDLEVGPDGWLTVDAKGLLGGGDILAFVPAGLPVEVLVDRGDVLVALERPADVHACAAAGEVTIEVPEGAYDLDLRGGAGEVSTEGVVHDPSAVHTIVGCVGAGELSVVGTW